MNFHQKSIFLFLAVLLIARTAIPAIALENLFSGTDSGSLVTEVLPPPTAELVLLGRTREPCKDQIQFSFESQQKSLYEAQGRTALGEPVTCAVEYDFALDLSRCGPGMLSGRIIPPKGMAVAEGVAYQIPYRVIEGNRVDLSCYSITSSGDVVFRWLRPIAPKQYLLLYHRDARGLWDLANHSMGTLSPTSLVLHGKNLLPDSRYYFCVSGEWLGSNTALVTKKDGEVRVDVSPRFPLTPPRFADQDGGDREEQTLSPIIQAMPDRDAFSGTANTRSGSLEETGRENGGILRQRQHSASSAAPSSLSHEKGGQLPSQTTPLSHQPAASQPVPSLETVTSDTSSFSGFRVKHMAATANWVVFEKHGIVVRISEAVLNALDLSDDDLFTVTIQKMDSRSFSFSLSVNQTPVEAFLPITIQYPFPQQGEIALIFDEENCQVDTARVYGSPLVAEFQITRPGIYSIGVPDEPTNTETMRVAAVQLQQTPSSDPPPNPMGPVIPEIAFITAAILCCTGGTFYLYYGRKKR